VVESIINKIKREVAWGAVHRTAHFQNIP